MRKWSLSFFALSNNFTWDDLVMGGKKTPVKFKQTKKSLINAIKKEF